MYADQIRRHRQLLGLSRQALADRMGVSATAVYKWENGQSQPDIPMLQRLADLFDVTLDELCDRPGRAPAPSEEDGTKLENIAVMTRAFRRLTQEEQEKYIAVGRALFEHAFEHDRQEKRRRAKEDET